MTFIRNRSFAIGSLAVTAGIVAWSIEWKFNWPLLNPVVLGCKVTGMVALVFWLRQIASVLFRSWQRMALLWTMLTASSIAGLLAFLPFRSEFSQWANDGMRRWYYEGMFQRENDYPVWLADWQSFGPHRFEAGTLAVFFILLLLPPTLFKGRTWSSVVACILSFTFLAIAPLWRGLLAFDYDTFHLGIALDSIALSLWPFGLGYTNAHTVFTLGFLAIIFAVNRLFIALPMVPKIVSKAPVDN